jgi:hypothetical protein
MKEGLDGYFLIFIKSGQVRQSQVGQVINF